MAKVDANTDYETASRIINAQVERLHSSLWNTTPEALEQKLSRTRFSEAEKVCVRVMNMASHTDTEDEAACEALGEAWEAQQGLLDAANEAAITEAERTGDYRRSIRLHELALMADSCVMACECW